MPFVGGLEERTFERSAFMVYARATGDVLEPNETQRNTLIAAGVYILVIGILWYVMSIVPYRGAHTVHRHVPYLDRISEYIDL